jgi:hypothetical protein
MCKVALKYLTWYPICKSSSLMPSEVIFVRNTYPPKESSFQVHFSWLPTHAIKFKPKRPPESKGMQSKWTSFKSLNVYAFKNLIATRGVSHCGLAIYIEKYLKAKKELWKLK